MRLSLRKYLLLTSLIVAVQSSVLVAARAQVKIARSGTTVVSATSPKGKAQVTIHTTIFDRSCVCSCPAAWALKELNVKEISVIEAFEISIDGKPLVVPDSVYDGLFDPHEASLRFENGSFVLLINGLDASNSYFVRIYFNCEGVDRFMTYWAIVPDRPSSDTHYFPLVLK